MTLLMIMAAMTVMMTTTIMMMMKIFQEVPTLAHPLRARGGKVLFLNFAQKRRRDGLCLFLKQRTTASFFFRLWQI